ncbi:hypothetical protein GCM10009796_16390 [Microbacterium koreense]
MTQRDEQSVRGRAGEVGAASEIDDGEPLGGALRHQTQKVRGARDGLSPGNGAAFVHDMDTTARSVHMTTTAWVAGARAPQDECVTPRNRVRVAGGRREFRA